MRFDPEVLAKRLRTSYLGGMKLKILGMLLHSPGYPPTLGDMSRDLRCTRNNIIYHLQALEAKGLVRLNRGTRTTVVTCTFIPAEDL